MKHCTYGFVTKVLGDHIQQCSNSGCLHTRQVPSSTLCSVLTWAAKGFKWPCTAGVCACGHQENLATFECCPMLPKYGPSSAPAARHTHILPQLLRLCFALGKRPGEAGFEDCVCRRKGGGSWQQNLGCHAGQVLREQEQENE